MDKPAVKEDMERSRAQFHQFLDTAGAAELRQPSAGTRWNNRQLLFHMLLGFLVVRICSSNAAAPPDPPPGAARVNDHESSRSARTH